MKNESPSPLKANSFMIEIDLGRKKIVVHPQSNVRRFRFENLEIFVNRSRYPVYFKNELEHYLETNFIKEYNADISGCLAKIEGDFSVVIVDFKHDSVLMGRDRFGRQCLYYTCTPGKIIISNSLRDIVELKVTSAQISVHSLDLYFGLGFIPGPYTVYKNISKIPAGCYVKIENSQINTNPFIKWVVPVADKAHQPFSSESQSLLESTKCSPNSRKEGRGIRDSNRNEHEEILTDKLHELLEESVNHGLDEIKQHTVLFSGGIDSSLVSFYLKKAGETKVNTIYIGDEKEREAEQAAAAAAFIDSGHRLIPKQFPSWQELSNLIAGLAEPLADTMLISMTRAVKSISKGAPFCWTGMGADDVFCGLYEHAALDLWEKGIPLPDDSIRQADAKSTYIIHNMLKKLYSQADPVSSWITLIRRMTQNDRYALLGNLNKKESQSPTAEFLRTWIRSTPDFFPGAKRFAAKVRLPDLTMRIIEASCFAGKIEHYSPFLTNPIADFADMNVLLPVLGDTKGKRLIRKLYRRLFPANLQNLPKRGFSLSLPDLLLYYRREIDLLFKDNDNDFLDPVIVRQWWEQFLRAKGERHRYAGRVWLVLIHLLWQQNRRG